MAQLVKHFVQDLQNDVKIRQLGTLVFNTDNLANVIEVELLDGGEAATVSGTVSCSVICSDGSTVPVTNGAISGNTVTVSLTADCGVIPGPIGVGIQITDGTVKTTVFKAIYNVELFETGTVIDPGSRITLSVSDLIDDIETAVASIPADYSDLLAAIAPAYSDLTFPVSAGTFCWYSGALYAANQDIPTSESWTAAHWKAVTLGGEVAELKSALSANGIATLITDGWITGKRMGTPDVGGTFSDSPGAISSWRYIKFECQPGDKFTINADGTSTFRTWAFADENLVCIARASLVNNDSVSVNETIVAPAAQGDYGDAKYLYINQDSSRGDCFVEWLLPGLLSQLDTEIDALYRDIAAVETNPATSAHGAGEYIIFDGQLYEVISEIAAGETLIVNTNIESRALGGEVADLQRKKANIDGSYEQMTVGNAEQLVSTVGVEDQAPYNFRTSGGAADIGDREVDKIVGGTIAWNQLVQNGNFANTDNWDAKYCTLAVNQNVGTLTVTDATASNSALRIQQNMTMLDTHVYFITMSVKCSKALDVYIKNNNGISVPKTTTENAWTQINVINVSVATFSGIMYFYLNRNGVLTTGDTVEIKNIMIIDLTQMFGSTIADYIYALETATTGAGVAWFRNLFPKDYYAYNAGELMSVQAASHKMVGFNAWDEEWELGNISSATGLNGNSDTRIRSKNYIPVVPGQTYYFHNDVGSSFALRYYDANKAYVGNASQTVNSTCTIPDGVRYLRFVMPTTYPTTYQNDICISLHWDGERDGEYEPYALYTYPLDDSIELRGIPKLDANNNLYYDGDTYESDGTVTRYWGTRAYTSGDETDGSTMITDGTNTVYKLTNPTTENADTYQNPQIVNDWGTEQYVDTAYEAGNRDVEIPVGHDTLYQANLRAKLEMAPDSPSDGNGDYIVRQTNGVNAYAKLVIPNELPTAPGSNGTYHLKSTVSSGSQALSWDGEIDKDVSGLKNAVGEVSSALRPETDLSSVGAANKVYGLNKDAGETVSAIAAPQNGYTAAKIACLAGDEFTLTAGIHGSGGALDDVVAWGFVEQDGAALKMIEHSEIGTSCQNKKLIAPSDGFLMVNHYTSATYSLKMKRLFQVPAAPTANGNYVLTVAVSDGVPTYSWTAQS